MPSRARSSMRACAQSRKFSFCGCKISSEMALNAQVKPWHGRRPTSISLPRAPGTSWNASRWRDSVLLALLSIGRDESIGARLGQLTFLGFAAYRLLPTLQQAFFSIVKIRSGRPAFTAITPDLRLARARKPAVSAADSSWRDRPRRDLRLDEVSFRYGVGRPAAINSVSMRIPARAAVGIVGANGSGKTTLVDLIAGLLVPQAGQIEVDGIALDDANRADWRRPHPYVPQDIFVGHDHRAKRCARRRGGGNRPRQAARSRAARAARQARRHPSRGATVTSWANGA